MVSYDKVRAANSALVASRPLVAVFVGGTAGIGEYAVQALASTHAEVGKGLRVYIVGRNQSAAEKTIADCRRVCPPGDFRFVQAKDLSLLRDVDLVCEEIINAEMKAIKGDEKLRIDFLCQTQGILSFSGRNETSEGLDKLMALDYYGRMRFIYQLLPLLENSPLPGHVVSVFNPNLEGKLVLEDLSLVKNFGFSTGSAHIALMNTLFMENIAARHNVSLSHNYPGFVLTDAVDNGTLPWWARWLWKLVIGPLITPWSTGKEESGQRTLFMASNMFPPRRGQDQAKADDEVAVSADGTVGGGAYRVG